MVALSVQTLLLMGAAYFLGAAIACLVRRVLTRSGRSDRAERRVDPLPEAAQSAGAARFGRTLEGDARPAAAP